jgi:integrase
VVLNALVFLFRQVLKKPLDVKGFKLAKRPRKLPVVLTTREIGLLLSQLQGLYALLAGLQYGTGMRLMEVIRLRVQDIDMGYQQIVIRNTKGNKDRLVPLPVHTLQVLRRFWLLHQHPTLLFPNRKRGLKQAHLANSHLNRGGVQVAMAGVVKELGIKKRISCHSLRHCYASHLLEAGVELLELQKILGHVSILTTVKYTHLTSTTTAHADQQINVLMDRFNIGWRNIS